MRFIDEETIEVAAGNGGSGSISFRRERFIPKGGPDGGNGGDGGCVIIQGNPDANTLHDFRRKKSYSAESGKHGAGKLRAGANGEDCIIKVPLGTIVSDYFSGELIADICTADEQHIVAKGGKGGTGNAALKSSINQSPRRALPAEQGMYRTLHLELQLLADISLLGMPNAGKSSLLAALSSAKPKIADYPFTTLQPMLGTVPLTEYTSVVIADIPGLIEGASEGLGLGSQFLKHISRTTLTLHMLDVSSYIESDDCMECAVRDYQMIRQEVLNFNEKLAQMPSWVLFTKGDLIQNTHEMREKLLQHFSTFTDKVMWFSSHSGEGHDALRNEIAQYMQEQSLATAEAALAVKRTPAALTQEKIDSWLADTDADTDVDSDNG